MGRVDSTLLIASEGLSDGRAEVTKLGRYYYFNRFYAEPLAPPEFSGPMHRGEALALLAETIKADVLEADG